MIQSNYLDLILKIIKLFRPNFYNRITWVVVCAGISMMSTSLIEKIIEVLFEKTFNITLTGQSDVAWGFALVCTGLIYHLINTGFFELITTQKKHKEIENKKAHDKNIFQHANELMNEEDFSDLLSWLLNDHSYTTNKCRKLEMFCDFLVKTENQFLLNELKSPAQSFLSNSYKLIEFLCLSFFVYPSSQTRTDMRLCMQPSWNIDRDGEGSPEEFDKYAKLTKELEQYVTDTQKYYHELRKNIKNQLFI